MLLLSVGLANHFQIYSSWKIFTFPPSQCSYLTFCQKLITCCVPFIVSNYCNIVILLQLAKQYNGTYIDVSAKKKDNIDQVCYSASGQFHWSSALNEPPECMACLSIKFSRVVNILRKILVTKYSCMYLIFLSFNSSNPKSVQTPIIFMYHLGLQCMQTGKCV